MTKAVERALTALKAGKPMTEGVDLDAFEEIVGMLGWQEYALAEPGAITRKVRENDLPLSLSFDPAVLAVDKVDAGEFLGGAGEAQVMSDSGRPGALVIGASRLGKVPGVKGTGTVARITFHAVAAGSSELSLDGKALDGSLHPLAVHSRPALIEVRAEPAGRPVPPAVPQREAAASGRR